MCECLLEGMNIGDDGLSLIGERLHSKGLHSKGSHSGVLWWDGVWIILYSGGVLICVSCGGVGVGIGAGVAHWSPLSSRER